MMTNKDFPNNALLYIRNEIFTSVTTYDANKVMDQLFIESMSSPYYDDAKERQKVIGTYTAVKILLCSIENNSTPSETMRSGIIMRI